MLDKYFPLYTMVFLSTMIFTAVIERRLIPNLKKYAKQPIYQEGPSWHIKKSGTPTMGGLAFVLSVSATLIFVIFFGIFKISPEFFISILITLLYAVLNSLIGGFDDLLKLKRKENAGLTPKQKLILQFICASMFLIARKLFLNDDTLLSFSFGEINIGFLYYPMALIILVGIVNCANLTDGIDGLASSVAFAIGISLFYISCALNTEAAVISASVMGAAIGFLLFNLHPAKIFMGDTGSLFFGSIIAASAFMLQNPFIIIAIAGVYVIEGISVLIQVFFYKLTHKRIFKMAPLHHHLEKCGWSENRICIAAIFVTLIMSLPAYIIYLP